MQNQPKRTNSNCGVAKFNLISVLLDFIVSLHFGTPLLGGPWCVRVFVAILYCMPLYARSTQQVGCEVKSDMHFCMGSTGCAHINSVVSLRVDL